MNVYLPKEAFNEIYIPHLENMAETQIFFGGSGSGKSVFLAQRCVVDLLNGGRNYLCARQVKDTVRDSMMAEIEQVINAWGLDHLFKIIHSPPQITCIQNSYMIIFRGLDKAVKLKSIRPKRGVITDIWIEEATETNYKDVKEATKRLRGGSDKTLKRITFSFNPILKSHWLYNEYFPGVGWADDQKEYNDGNLSIQKTWYIHNRFMTEQDKRRLEDESDKYFYQVYTLGNWGILGNVIFTNWRAEDLSELKPTFANPRHGLDFGYIDPVGFVMTDYNPNRKTIHIYDEIYESGLTNDVLADRVKDKIGKDLVICDSSEPKSIRDLQLSELYAKGAVKGKDSIIHGIKWLQQQQIIVDVNCVGVQKELGQYKWKEDKNGDAMEVPVDKFNHLIDALRYAYENEMRSKMSASQMIDSV